MYKLNTLIKRPSNKQLDDLWRKAVYLKAGNVCEYPGCRKNDYLNPHHIYSRSRKSVRWDVENGIALCSGHHCLTNESAHKDPNFLRVLVKGGVRTQKFLDKLERKAKAPAKIDRCLEKLALEKEIRLLKKILPYKINEVICC